MRGFAPSIGRQTVHRRPHRGGLAIEAKFPTIFKTVLIACIDADLKKKGWASSRGLTPSAGMLRHTRRPTAPERLGLGPGAPWGPLW